MKKYASILIASALVSSLILQPTVIAEVTENTEDEVQQENFIKVTGEIDSITEETKGNYFATVKNGDGEFGFYFNDQTLIYNSVGDKVELSEGVEITSFVDARKPMIMIYPPRYSPDVVVVHGENTGAIQIQRFNDKLLNEKGDIIISVNDETVIHDLDGKSLSRDEIVNKDVLIFYDLILESYPAQISPLKIVVLEKELSKIEKAIAIVDEDFYEIEGVTMIPLRKVAEQLGFQVDSTGSGAIVSKGNVSFLITRGTKQYGYNKALRYFQEEPELLEKNKTYVPYEFLEQLIELTEDE